MPDRDRTVAPESVSTEPMTGVEADEFFHTRPAKYREALKIVADEHHIDQKLCAGPSDEIFYLEVAKAFLGEAIHEDPWNAEMVAAALAANAAIDTATHNRAPTESNAAIKRMRTAVRKAVAIAAKEWMQHSGLPFAVRGRPRGSYNKNIASLIRAASIDLERPWHEVWPALCSYIEGMIREIKSQYERDKERREMKVLLGPKGEKAREVYRTLRKHRKDTGFSVSLR
ncbi:MAG: hypothetical protein ACREFD_18445 [Stellaceae bacterium]